MASSLEKGANVLLIIASAAVIGQVGYNVINKPGQKPLEFKPGSHIQGTSALAISSAPRTLIMITASTCPYCNASMPFYKQITGIAHKAGARIVAVSAETPQINRAFLESHGVTFDTVLSQAESGVQTARIPTLILVRTDGTIINSWVGQAHDAMQKAVIKAVGKKLSL